MPVLVKINGNPPDQLIEIKEDETIIGRLPECGVVLARDGVSRRHAAIRRSGRDYYLADLKSRNKTYLNEREVLPEAHQILHQGDHILICDVEMVFYHTLPPEWHEGPGSRVEVIEEGDSSTLHTVDASRADLLVGGVRPEVKLAAVLDISRNLSSALKLENAAPEILESLLKIFPQAERCFLILLRENEARPTIRQAFHKVRPLPRTGGKRAALNMPTGDESRLSISKTILNTVVGQRKAVLSQDAPNDANLPTSASIADLRIRSFMCAPLLTPDGHALGVLQLDTTDRKQFSQEDLDLLVVVADQASTAVQYAAMHESLVARERVDRDLRLAEQVQKRFLPQEVPTIAGYEFFADYKATYEVGGDYYDFIPLPGDRLAIALGDVSGKGVAAALMMAKFTGDARYCISTKNEPSQAADALNLLLYETSLEERFITLCLGVLDLAAHRFTFTSAGHPPVLVRRADGQVETLGHGISGFPLGIMPTSNYKQTSVDLKPGDVVVLYSDGVTDPRNMKEELYDSVENPRLRKRVAATPGGAQAIGRSIVQETREFSAGHSQTDDFTLVCFGLVRPK